MGTTGAGWKERDWQAASTRQAAIAAALSNPELHRPFIACRPRLDDDTTEYRPSPHYNPHDHNSSPVELRIMTRGR
ncbi:MAG TPA: hypothetical protein VJ805_05045 [Nitrospiraceae bacterium]|nr:hypothetical protein [Nitrospiraceae bacterium]